jgi:hypothetical protein
MSRWFKISACDKPPTAAGETFCIGIPVRVADRETVIPISDSCHTFEALARASKDIQDDLNLLLKEAEAVFHPETLSEAGLRFPQGMGPDKVWAILKEMDGEEAFVEAFNQLDQERRGSVAEHVLTKCNIFSGRAAVFSSRYNSATGLLE